MSSYKFAVEKANFKDCGGVLKFTFYFLPSKCVKSGRVTVGHGRLLEILAFTVLSWKKVRIHSVLDLLPQNY